MKKQRFAAIMLMCITLAGCGNMGDEVNTETEQTPIATPTPDPTPAQSFVYGEKSPWLADSGSSEGTGYRIAGNNKADIYVVG